MQPLGSIEKLFSLQNLRRLAWAIVGLTYILVSLGVTVRANNAGLSCPDWPLCYGRLFYSGDYGALLEQIHRFVAGAVGILLALIAIGMLFRARTDKQLILPTILAVVLLAVQIVLGGLTVLMNLAGPILISHLATAQAFFATIIAIAVATGKPSINKEPRAKTLKFARLAAISAILVYGLMLSGSYVFNSGASLACSGWPLCGDAAPAAITFHLTDINMLHRYVAGIIGLVLLWTLISAWRRRSVAPGQAWLAVACAIFFLLQAGVGALVVLLNRPILIAILHLVFATAVFGCIALIAALAARQLRAEPVIPITGSEERKV